MRMFTERTQVLLSPAQRARVERLARERGVSIGAVVREAIEAYTATDGSSREQALDALEALDAPVGDWQDMKQEILRGAGG
jgi:predicted DNA-binding protein